MYKSWPLEHCFTEYKEETTQAQVQSSLHGAPDSDLYATGSEFTLAAFIQL